MEANYVAVEVMVQLVMKSTRMVTPGKLLLTVQIDRNWMCDCPGVSDFHIGETYIITGFMRHVKRKLKKSGYEVRVNHNSIVKPWREGILDKIVKKEKEYHGLKFVPSLNVYKAYLPYLNLQP